MAATAAHGRFILFFAKMTSRQQLIGLFVMVVMFLAGERLLSSNMHERDDDRIRGIYERQRVIDSTRITVLEKANQETTQRLIQLAIDSKINMDTIDKKVNSIR